MKKSYLIFICIILWYIGFYALSSLFKSIISNNTLIVFLSFFIPTFIVTIIYYSIKKIVTSRNDKVKEYSVKYKKIQEINEMYNFLDVKNKIKLEENEFSIKSFNDILAKQVVLYRIENNEDNIREWIENAMVNEDTYKKYKEVIESINDKTDISLINKIGFSETKFNNIEKQLIDSSIISDKVYNIAAHVIVNYVNKNYDIIYKKDRYVEYNELVSIYEEWKNSKKYKVTTEKERKLMNYSLREEVLKRDGYKCVVCGKTEQDGVRLEIDHIIPVSKGGQSTISNLQTLCSSCNAKKNTQDNDSFKKRFIKDKLIQFRRNRSKELDIPAYYIFTNNELDKILELMPKNVEELKKSGILPNIKIAKHGELIIKVINEK